ncbi:hypothetical protein CFC21_096495 [Triticum aestivum]|uniref:Uncharacterized protein n=3 Tax=Triticum TaxID=4564 RepID=A0A9R0Z6E9_TRITD|nr:hypothetical protein CFC21_096495 [Triticum aestivum]VAI71413.1 unnamed protein product [Triticum turgidum subsp. durum]
MARWRRSRLVEPVDAVFVVLHPTNGDSKKTRWSTGVRLDNSSNAGDYAGRGNGDDTHNHIAISRARF